MSLSDQFSITTLPRVSDIKLSEKAVVSGIRSAQQQVLDIGISRSSICSIILKPTPKLIWTYALSPNTIVDYIDVAETEDTSIKQFAIGTTDRKKDHNLLFLRRYNQESEEHSSTTPEGDQDQQESVSTKSIKTKSKVVSTHFSKDSRHVYVILDDCTVEVYQYNLEDNEDEENNDSPIYSNLNRLRNSRTLYHQFIETGEINKGDGVLVLVELINKKKVQVRLLSLDLENTIEIKSVVLEEDMEAGSAFTYDSIANCLYEFSKKENTLKMYTLPDFRLFKTIPFGSILERKQSVTEVTMVSPAPERLLISFEGIIYLINTKYDSILDKFSHQDKISLETVFKVKGNSLRTSQTFAVFFSHDAKANVSDLNVINVDVGLGTLSECLGKGISKVKSDAVAKFSGLSDLLDDKFVDNSIILTNEINEIYEELKNASEESNLKKWERIVIPYLKGESWTTIKKSIKKLSNKASTNDKLVPVTKDYEFKVFEVEKDRIIDYNFIYSITSLIFSANDDNGDVQFKSKFNPEHSLTYLFTHPLYPKEFTKGLLSLFAKRSEEIDDSTASSIGSLRLLRQALITCPNLSCLEITKQLNNSNDEIFQDVVSRLIEEYSINQITSTLLEVLKQTTAFNLEECIKKCFILDNGWEIIPAIIDAGGLFGWSKDLIDKVIEDVEIQLESLNLNGYNLTLTNQAILVNSSLVDTSAGKKKSKKQKKKELKQQQQQAQSNGAVTQDIVESNKQQEQLNSMLTINNTSRKNLLDDGISISKKIPVYSVEKLIL
ncbi:hypothetical protein CLIB1423_11S03422 [[Candida] railenensis]|uniref:U3 small nucleolar RNA-associated protein 8 n=1 Tax=[Candida] railenensis TaxID=45579 RepID=A0A9P0QSJ2_9ASCO|nr:hypothetical protein CLIB1423_11S03422 [[Candida] railenensis]